MTPPTPRAGAAARLADPITYLCLITVNLIWGAAYLVIAVALRSFTPLALTGVRLALSTVFLWLYARWSGERIAVARGDHLALFGLGFLLNTVFQVCLNAALNHTTPSHASLGVATMPIFTALFAWWFVGERLSPARLGAILMAFVGVVIIIVGGQGLGDARGTFLGDVLALGTAVTWALGSVLSKPFLRRYSPCVFSVLTLAAGTVTAVPFVARDLVKTAWGAVTPGGWLALLYLAAFSMAAAWVLWNRGISRVDVAQAAIFSNLSPVVTLLLSAILFGEALTLPLVTGGALVIAGAYLTQRT